VGQKSLISGALLSVTSMLTGGPTKTGGPHAFPAPARVETQTLISVFWSVGLVGRRESTR
jgi:hypothetical protein